MVHALLLLTTVLAHAGDGASPSLPSPPPIDHADLPTTAEVRPTNGDGSPHQARTRLLVDRAPVVPGEPFRLGIELIPDAGWHSYWRAPGDIGLPLKIVWDLPPGTTTTEPVFPVPQRFEQSGIVSYGYDGPVVLHSVVTLPPGVTGPLTVGASTEWLVCQESCVPGRATLGRTLEVGTTSSPTPAAALFDHYEGLHPTPAPRAVGFAIEGAVSQTAYRPEDPFEAVFLLTPTSGAPLGLAREHGTWPAFVPIVDGYEVFVDAVEVRDTPEGGLLAMIRGEVIEVDPLPAQSVVGGLFQVDVGGERVAVEYTTTFSWAPKGASVASTGSPLLALAGGAPLVVPEAAPPVRTPPPEPPSTAWMLLFAFVGGLLLNVMPCVFPVITLKLFGLVAHAESGAATQRSAGIAYTAGILASFWALAAAVLVAKATMGGVGWGFQFQSPLYVAALATLVFAFGLSLFGVFEVPALGADTAAHASARGGLAGDFFNGVFATLLATPCTAPFLGPAVGFAFLQPAAVVVLFFTVIGLGLAAPFLIVSFVPALFRFLPRPGAWMDTFKQLMGFTLIATTLWLVAILAEQLGTPGAIGFLVFLAFVALGAWVFGRWGGLEQSRGRQLGAFAVGAAIAAAGGYFWLDFTAVQDDCDDGSLATELSFQDGIPWQAFSEERVAALAGTPVFIDFTATWCLTCKVNERTVLETDAVRDAMRTHGVVPLKADWTRQDPVIGAWLQRHGRAGVPFYLVIPADPAAAPIALPELITPSQVIDAFARAAGNV